MHLTFFGFVFYCQSPIMEAYNRRCSLTAYLCGEGRGPNQAPLKYTLVLSEHVPNFLVVFEEQAYIQHKTFFNHVIPSYGNSHSFPLIFRGIVWGGALQSVWSSSIILSTFNCLCLYHFMSATLFIVLRIFLSFFSGKFLALSEFYNFDFPFFVCVCLFASKVRPSWSRGGKL